MVETRNTHSPQPKIISLILTTLLCLTPAAASYSAPVVQNPLLTKPLASSGVLNSGTQFSLNGQTLPAAWSQQIDAKTGQATRIGISDVAVEQLLGIELLNTTNAARQPVKWFSPTSTAPLVLDSWLSGKYRYLDLSPVAALAGWGLKADGNVLRVTTPRAEVQAIRQGQQSWGTRIVVDLDRPTLWRVTPPLGAAENKAQEWAITIEAFAAASASAAGLTCSGKCSPKNLVKVESNQFQTTVRLNLPGGVYPSVNTLPNPNRLVIDMRSDVIVNRDIVWASGLRWRQQLVNLGTARFPVVWLEVNPRAVGLSLKPITSKPDTLVGIDPLLKTAQRYRAAAAINGGFFNRNNQLPLGAIRRDGRWLSSPILNRGAIAWNDAGEVRISHLNIQETLITSTGQRFPLLNYNSGYVKAGIARYSREWGNTYTPLIDNETVVVVQNNQVTAQLPGGAEQKTTFGIPLNGYLLALRANNTAAKFLPAGTIVRSESATVPAELARYPHILGAGPVLLQNRQNVLDAKVEGFSNAFIQETAVRSAVGSRADGTLLIATVNNRLGGKGPTLIELVGVMQQLECVDALNLDGGSSTSLYLGGQLLNRSPRTAARVHNGIGIFLQGEKLPGVSPP